MDRALRHLGFAQVRQRGSHVLYRHPDGRDLAVPLTREILREIKLTPEQFAEALAQG